jgi:hypothetical protein
MKELESMQYVNENETARILDCSVQTLRNQRHQGKGLPYRKFGRAVRYRVDEIIAFIEDRKIMPDHHLRGGK